MAGQLLLLNPKRRRRSKRKAHSRRRSRGARRMSALQLKYFGGGRKRRASRRRRAVYANPSRRRRSSPRRQRGFARAGGLRLPRVGFNMSAVQSAAKTAAIGASGALAVDVLMGQAGRVLPETWLSRFNADGSINWPYYLTKAGLAIGVGVIGSRYGRGFGPTAQQMAIGSLIVQGYELLRAFVPADLVTLGYYNPGRVLRAPNVAGLRGARGGMGAYLKAPASSTSLQTMSGMARLRGLGSVRGTSR